MSEKRLHLLEIFPRIIEVSNSNIAVENRLKYVCDILKKELGVDCVCVYRLPFQSLYLEPWVSSCSEVGPCDGEKFKIKLGEGVSGLAAWKRKPIYVRDLRRPGKGISLVPFEARDFVSVYSIPIKDDVYVYGAMNFSSLEEREFSDEEMEVIRAVSIEVAGTIRNARLYTDARKRVSELLTINEISRAVTSTFRLNEILSYALRTTSRIVGADGAVVRIYDSRRRRWEIQVSEGFEKGGLKEEPKKVGGKVAGFILREMRPILVNSPEDSLFFRELASRGIGSFMGVPIVSKGKAVGVMSFYRREGRERFTHETLNLVHTVSILLANVVENVRMYREAADLARENQIKVARLEMLYNIARTLMSTIKTDKLLNLMLDALTSPEGFHYSRAILFLISEDGKYLIPRLAYGPLSRKDARELARLIKKRNKTEEDERRIAELRGRFFNLVGGYKISLGGDEDCVVADSVRAMKAVNCSSGCGKFLKSPNSFCSHHGRTFLVVPMIVKGRAKGAIYVDNEFSERELKEEDVHVLTMFASEAGLALENSELYENLERALEHLKKAQDRLLQSEKLAALGEMAAQLAHEIKNPLTVVGGFASRLLKVLSQEFTGEEGKKLMNYAWVIMKEVRRLERIVNQTLYFSRDKKLVLSDVKVNGLIKEVLDMFEEEFEEKRIELRTSFEEGLPVIRADSDQIKQMLWNIVSNAEQAMSDGGKLTVSTRAVEEPFSGVEIVISDTGGGIPPEVLGNIFNPFFTTRPSGTGLGLPIVHTIVTRHGGMINLDNRVGEGVTFHVVLPENPEQILEERNRERIFRGGINGFKNEGNRGEGEEGGEGDPGGGDISL